MGVQAARQQGRQQVIGRSLQRTKARIRPCLFYLATTPLPRQARRAWRVSPVGGSAFHTLRERWWFIPFDLLRVKPLRDGFPVYDLASAGSRPGGRPPFLLRQERRQRRRPGFTGRPSADCPALLPAGGRRGTRPSGSDSRAGRPRLLVRGSKVQTGFQRSTEPLRKPIWRLTVDHLDFRSPLTCRLEVMTGGKRASHV